MQPYHLYMFQTIAKEDKIQETIAGAVSLTSPTQETNLKKKGCNTFPSLASAAKHILYTLFQNGGKYIIFCLHVNWPLLPNIPLNSADGIEATRAN